MANSPTIMIVSGEASGDILGADLMADIKKLHPSAQFIGVGGELMQAQGLSTVFPLSELEVMGLVEIIPAIPRLRQRVFQLIDSAKATNIDMLITIDAPDFTLRLASRIKKQLNVPCLHYVSPSVWAWRKNRVNKMAKYLDHVLALFPFEPKYYENSGLNCSFVGHPLSKQLDKYSATIPKAPPAPKLAIMPGSRAGEISKLLPQMIDAFNKLKSFPELANMQAVLPLKDKSDLKKLEGLEGLLSKDITTVFGEERYAAIQSCRAAIVASGTANLELALLGIPMVVTYKVSNFTYKIAKKLIKVPYISPVNWVAGKKVVPELIQAEATAANIQKELLQLLTQDKTWKKQANTLANIKHNLSANNATSAAQIVKNYL